MTRGGHARYSRRVHVRLYRYVGPDGIRDRPRAEPGTGVRAPAELAAWLRVHPEALRAPVTFVVDAEGVLRGEHPGSD